MEAAISVLHIDVRFERPEFTLTANATIDSGVTGICGPSGCGKSTLLALLAGLLTPTRGVLRFDGTTLADTASSIFVPAWQRHFGVVFQDGLLFPHLTVRENLLYGWKQLTPERRRFDLQGVLELLDIQSLVRRRPAQLSGGERQRVALGRALLYSPRLLLLDEPLSALDERLKQQILPFLKRIKEETRVPMIYVSHSQAEVEYVSDRVLRMSVGALTDRGDPVDGIADSSSPTRYREGGDQIRQ